MANDIEPTLQEVANFLLGQGTLRGVWYGEKPAGEKASFWWRSDLRDALAAPAGDMAPAAPQDERDRFEAWAKSDSAGVNFERDADGDYINMSAALLWHGWQARAALPAQAVAPARYTDADMLRAHSEGFKHGRRDALAAATVADEPVAAAALRAFVAHDDAWIADSVAHSDPERAQKYHDEFNALIARARAILATPVQDVAPSKPYGFHLEQFHASSGQVVNDTFSREDVGADMPSNARGFKWRITPVFATTPAVAKDVAPSDARWTPVISSNPMLNPYPLPNIGDVVLVTVDLYPGTSADIKNRYYAGEARWSEKGWSRVYRDPDVLHGGAQVIGWTSMPAPIGDAAQPAAQPADHEFKNFHRLLCERFGYSHDERDWKRDQISLIEWIAGKVAGQPADAQDAARLDALIEGGYLNSIGMIQMPNRENVRSHIDRHIRKSRTQEGAAS